MNSFWQGFSEQFKDCGRDATLFLMTLAGMFGLLVLTAIVMQTDLRNAIGYGLAVAACVFVIRLVVVFRRAIIAGRQRTKRMQLSSDELLKARSKLLKHQNRGSL